MFDINFSWLGQPMQVGFIDLLLGADNALIIALACQRLPPDTRGRLILLGISSAVLLRFLLTSMASCLLQVPGIRLIGALLLIIIAINLLRPEICARSDAELGASGSLLDQTTGNLWSALLMILLADVLMSFDSMVALAAVARGSTGYLALGLLMSAPALMLGSTAIVRLMQHYPWLVTMGGALLGWVSGDMIVNDISIADWVRMQAPALALTVPLLTTLYVLLQARMIAGEKRELLSPERSLFSRLIAEGPRE